MKRYKKILIIVVVTGLLVATGLFITSKINQEITSLEKELSVAALALDSTNNELRDMSVLLSETKSDLSDTKRALSSIENKLNQANCKSAVEIDYTSNYTVSESIKSYLGDSQGSINKTEWEVVWNNSKVSYHKLTGEYLHLFIVYFDDKDMGYSNSVFNIGDQCWLDQ